MANAAIPDSFKNLPSMGRYVPRGTIQREFVQRRQGRDLVALRQCRVIKHGVDKIIELAAVGEDRLADMNQLCGAFADHMDT